MSSSTAATIAAEPFSLIVFVNQRDTLRRNESCRDQHLRKSNKQKQERTMLIDQLFSFPSFATLVIFVIGLFFHCDCIEIMTWLLRVCKSIYRRLRHTTLDLRKDMGVVNLKKS